MTLNELKKMARWGIAKWLDRLPKDGDYDDTPKIVSHLRTGKSPDGDYAVTFIFHNKKEGTSK